jgi:predicted lactoylglutathione lyase
MKALGAEVAYDRADALGFGERNRPHDDVHTYVSIFESKTANVDDRRHWCLRAASAAEVDAFHAAGLDAGGSSAGAPEKRSYHPGYYAAFLRDPEGNKIEAVFHRVE